jgi:methyl-accepting chemotaxis protein
MSVIRNIPLGRKFVIAFGIVCVLCLVLGVYSLLTFRAIAQKNGNMSQVSFPSVLALAQIRNAANNARREDLNLLLCMTQDCRAPHFAKRQAAWSDYDAGIKLYEPLISNTEERERFEKFSTAFLKYRKIS